MTFKKVAVSFAEFLQESCIRGCGGYLLDELLDEYVDTVFEIDELYDFWIENIFDKA